MTARPWTHHLVDDDTPDTLVESTAPQTTDPIEWNRCINNATLTMRHWDYISAAPQSVRLLLEISRPVGHGLAVPHTLRGDEKPPHLNPDKLRYKFNCHPAVASRLAEMFTTFEFDARTVDTLARDSEQYGGPLGLAFHLETLALQADIHPALQEEHDIPVELVPYDEQHTPDEPYTGAYETIAYHPLETNHDDVTDTIRSPQTARRAWPAWANDLPLWARQLMHRVSSYDKPTLQQAARYLSQKGDMLSSSARQYLWDLIKERFAAFRPRTASTTSDRRQLIYTWLISHAQDLCRLDDLAKEMTRLPEGLKQYLRPLWTARRSTLQSAEQMSEAAA